MRLTVGLVQVFDCARSKVFPLLHVVFNPVRQVLALVDRHDMHHFGDASITPIHDYVIFSHATSLALIDFDKRLTGQFLGLFLDKNHVCFVDKFALLLHLSALPIPYLRSHLTAGTAVELRED